MSDQNTTHFGFQQVPTEQKQKKVNDVFHSVAAKYDLMNDVMSMGIHRYWKHYTIEQTFLRPGHCALDLAGGTGDLTEPVAKRVGPMGQVVLSDINAAMLGVGRDKLTNRGIVGNIQYVQANAERLPFNNSYFDCITIAFGLRNVTDQSAALQSMYRTLKPGGRLLVLEFSKPAYPWLTKLYDFYSFELLPRLGRWIAQDADSYRYLAESIRRHPDQDTLKQMMLDAGFDQVTYTNLSQGIVALHIGEKY